MLRNKPSHFSCLGIFIQAHRPQATWRRDLISVTTVSVENAARQSPETTISLSKTSDRSQGYIPVPPGLQSNLTQPRASDSPSASGSSSFTIRIQNLPAEPNRA